MSSRSQDSPQATIKKYAYASILVAAVSLGALAVWLLIRAPAYDIAKVDTSLRRLKEPFQSVEIALVQDGGTLVIGLTDNSGQIEYFVFPCKLGEPHDFDRLFVGAAYYDEPGAIEIVNPRHTKRMLIDISGH